MAATSVVLDIRANTTRALNEFKKFSSQLDNKFLVSGLKLDVVRSALGQINREFQKAIGEQGLQAGASLRAAENQAAMLLGTFKGVGVEASRAITEQFSQSFNQIAVQAGGTAKDVQKALSATAFISTNLSEDLRKQLSEGMMKFQIDAKRAGLGEEYSAVIQRYLAGQVSARDLIQTGNPLESRIGAELSRAAGTDGILANAEQRSRAVLRAQQEGPGSLAEELREGAERADWGRSVLEQLNAKLFNPREGIFGSLREVTLAIGDKTSIFRETRKLIESVFGRQGFFVNFFAQIGKIFGIEDPLAVVIKGVRWLTRQFNKLTRFLESPMVQGIVGLAQKTIQGVVTFFTDIYNQVSSYLQSEEGQQVTTKITAFFANLFRAIDDTVKAGDWDPSKIQEAIRKVGTDVRAFIRNVGESFRNLDIKQQGNFVLEIIGTLVEEIARTIGAVISEGIKTIFSERGLSVLMGLVGVINKGLTGFFSEIFGNGFGGILGAVVTGGVVLAFGKKITLAVVAFGAKLIAALPGSSLITRAFGSLPRAILTLGRNLTSSALRLVGLSALAERVRVPLAAGVGTNRSAVSALGTTQTFQRQVVFYLTRIAGCVCVPGFSRGGGKGSTPIIGSTARGRATVSSLGGPKPVRPTQPVLFPQDGPAVLRSRDRIMRPRPSTGGGRGLGSMLGQTLFGTGRSDAMSARPMYGFGTEDRRNIAARFNRRYGSGGTRAVFGRGLGGGKAALAGLGLAAVGVGGLSLFGGGSARAGELPKEYQEELESIKAQQKMEREELMQMGGSRGEIEALQSQQSAEISQLREQLAKESKQEGRENTKGLLGIGTGLAGGWAGGKAGAGIGAMVGGPWGAAIGGVVGGLAGAMLGEEAVKLLSDGVLDSIGDVARKVGRFFTETVPSKWNSAFEAIGNWIGVTRTRVVNFFTKTVPELFSNGLRVLGVEIPRSLINFGRRLGTSMLDSVAKFDLGDVLKNTWEFIKNTAQSVTGTRSLGGNAYVGRNLLVGEHGPEVFTPTTNGTIIPNHALTTASSSSQPISVSANFNINLNASGAMTTNDLEALRGPILAILEEAWSDVSSSIVKRGAIV
jgi:hypothetical protein